MERGQSFIKLWGGPVAAKKNVQNEKLDIKSSETVTGDEDTGSFPVSGLPDAPDFGPFLKSESGGVVQAFEFTDTGSGGFTDTDDSCFFAMPDADAGELPQCFGPPLKYTHELGMDQDEPAIDDLSASLADQSISKAVDLINDALADNADQSDSIIKGDAYFEHVEISPDVDFARPTETFEG